jgi:hypothetical protein
MKNEPKKAMKDIQLAITDPADTSSAPLPPCLMFDVRKQNKSLRGSGLTPKNGTF